MGVYNGSSNGNPSSFNGVNFSALCRLTADGELDSSFAPSLFASEATGSWKSASVRVTDFLVDSDGKILVGGEFQTARHLRNDAGNMGYCQYGLVRLEATGGLDVGFMQDVVSQLDDSARGCGLRSSNYWQSRVNLSATSDSYLVGGDFSDFNGVAGRRYLVKIAKN